MKFLLAIDGSKFSEAAARALVTQARPQGDEVRVLYVVDILTNQLPEMDAYYPGIEHARDAQRNFAEAAVEKTAHPWSLATQHIKSSKTLLNGMPI